MNTSPNEPMVHAADFAEGVHRDQQQLEASGALVRPLGAFERMYHRYEQKSTMHFCVVAELADALLAVQRRHPMLNVYVGDHPQTRLGFYRAPSVPPVPVTVVDAAPG